MLCGSWPECTLLAAGAALGTDEGMPAAARAGAALGRVATTAAAAAAAAEAAEMAATGTVAGGGTGVGGTVVGATAADSRPGAVLADIEAAGTGRAAVKPPVDDGWAVANTAAARANVAEDWVPARVVTAGAATGGGGGDDDGNDVGASAGPRCRFRAAAPFFCSNAHEFRAMQGQRGPRRAHPKIGRHAMRCWLALASAGRRSSSRGALRMDHEMTANSRLFCNACTFESEASKLWPRAKSAASAGACCRRQRASGQRSAANARSLDSPVGFVPAVCSPRGRRRAGHPQQARGQQRAAWRRVRQPAAPRATACACSLHNRPVAIRGGPHSRYRWRTHLRPWCATQRSTAAVGRLQKLARAREQRRKSLKSGGAKPFEIRNHFSSHKLASPARAVSAEAFIEEGC